MLAIIVCLNLQLYQIKLETVFYFQMRIDLRDPHDSTCRFHVKDFLVYCDN